MSTLSTNQVVVEYVLKSDQIKKATDEFDGATESTEKFKKKATETGQTLNGMGGIASKLGPALAAAFSVAAISAFAKQIVETTIKFEGYNKAIEFGSGNAENFAKNQEFLTNLINKYGLGLAQTTEAYKQFFNASTLAGQSQAETNRQFEAVTKAGTVLKLTTDQMQGAFLALGQMMSKGTVQAEELRGQLGERIPGAFGIMAKALHVNEQQLNKMLEQGQVLSKTALPAFANELEKTFGPAAEKNLNGMVNSQNRFNNSIDNLVLAIGNRLNPFLKGAYDLAAGIANEIAKAAGAGVAESKKAAEDKIATARIERDFVKETIALDQSRTVKITAANIEQIRTQIARQKLLEIELLIENQQLKVAEAKVQASGQFNTKGKVNLERQEKELRVLYAMEEQYIKISGIIVSTPPPPPPVDPKELKNEYDQRVKLLDIQKKIAELQIQLRTDAGFEREIELTRNAEKFGKERLNLDLQFGEQGVQAAKDNAKTQGLVNQNLRNDSINLIKKEAKAGSDAASGVLDDIKKQMQANEDFETKRGLDQQKQLEADAKLAKDQVDIEQEKQDKIKEIDKKSKEDQKKLQADLIQLLIEETEAYAMVAQSVTQGILNNYTQSINNELIASQNRYDAEIRLAGENDQKVVELKEKQQAKEKELRTKQFEAQRAAAIANVIFRTAPIIAEYLATGILAPLAAGALAAQAVEIGAILAAPVPQFKDGTKGTPYQGKAIVGEEGRELVVTTSGNAYLTPGTASLVDFKEKSHVIPHDITERFLGSYAMNSTAKSGSDNRVVDRLVSLENTLKGIPITQLNMDERGFKKFIRTENRTTKILNNRFGN